MGIFDKLKQKTESVDLGRLKEKVNLDMLKEKAGNSKPVLVAYACNVNYDKAISSVDKLGGKYPETTGLLYLLKEESERYKASEAEGKEDAFIHNVVSRVDPVAVLDEIEPIVSYIPHGNHIVMLLKYLAKRKK